ncbi:hypothetical protein KY334_05795 [Candidatus Woesearchaeota archaeon]|nr:hypothetical protein [Candidatus Woesearchaeota archaeon]
MQILTQEDIEKIRKDPDNRDWFWLSSKCILPEDFMREFQDYILWSWIPYTADQQFSESFIREFSHEMLFYRIVMHHKLSEELFLEFKSKLFNKYHQLKCYTYKNYHNIKLYIKHDMKLDNAMRKLLIS